MHPRGRLGRAVDRQHLRDGGDPGDGFFAELTNSVGERAQQLAVDVDGAAAHACDHSGVLWFGPFETRQDHVLAGAEDIFEDSEYLHVHGFRLGAFKDCVRQTVEAAVHLREGKDSRFGRRRRRSRANLGDQAARNNKNCGQN